MKGLNQKFKVFIPIFLLIFLAQSKLYAQTSPPCYQRLIDASGLNTDSYQSTLTAGACSLRDSFPNAYQRNDFRVFDCGFYVLHTVTSGYPAEFQKKIDQAAAISPFYVLFGKQNEPKGLYTKIYVAMSLPDTGYFHCINLISPTYREEIRFKIELVANNALIREGIGWPAYAKAEEEAMDSLKSIFSNLKTCCIANRSNSTNVCGECTLLPDEFESMLKNHGLIISTSITGSSLILQNSNINSDYIFGRSHLEVTVDQSHIANLDLNAYCKVKYYKDINKSAAAYIINARNNCSKSEAQILAFIADQSFAKFLYFIIPGTLSNTVKVITVAIIDKELVIFPNIYETCAGGKNVEAEIVLTDPVSFFFAANSENNEIKDDGFFFKDESGTFFLRDYVISEEKISHGDYLPYEYVPSPTQPVYTGNDFKESIMLNITPYSIIKPYLFERPPTQPTTLISYYIGEPVWTLQEKGPNAIVTLANTDLSGKGKLFDLLKENTTYVLTVKLYGLNASGGSVVPGTECTRSVFIKKCEVKPVFIAQYKDGINIYSHFVAPDLFESDEINYAFVIFNPLGYNPNSQKNYKVAGGSMTISKNVILEINEPTSTQLLTKVGLTVYYKVLDRIHIVRWQEPIMSTKFFSTTWDCIGEVYSAISDGNLPDSKIVSLPSNELFTYVGKGFAKDLVTGIPSATPTIEFALKILDGVVQNEYEFEVSVLPPNSPPGGIYTTKITYKLIDGSYVKINKRYKNTDIVGDPSTQCELNIKPGSKVQITSFKSGKDETKKGNWSWDAPTGVNHTAASTSNVTVTIPNADDIGSNELLIEVIFKEQTSVFIKVKKENLQFTPPPVIHLDSEISQLKYFDYSLLKVVGPIMPFSESNCPGLLTQFNKYIGLLDQNPLLWDYVKPVTIIGGTSVPSGPIPVKVYVTNQNFISDIAGSSTAAFTSHQDFVSIDKSVVINKILFNSDNIITYGFLNVPLLPEEEGCIFNTTVQPIPNEIFTDYLVNFGKFSPKLPNGLSEPLDTKEATIKGELINANLSHLAPSFSSENAKEYIYRHLRENEVEKYIYVTTGFCKIYLSSDNILKFIGPENMFNEVKRLMDHEICHAIFPFRFPYHKLVWSNIRNRKEAGESLFTNKSYGKSDCSSGSAHEEFDLEDDFTCTKNGQIPGSFKKN